MIKREMDDRYRDATGVLPGIRPDGSFCKYKFVVDKMMRMTGDPSCTHGQMALMLTKTAEELERRRAADDAAWADAFRTGR